MKHRDLYRPKKRSPTRKERRRKLEDKIATADHAGREVVLLSHGHCLDGVGSAIMVLRALGTDGVGIAYIQPSAVAEALELLTTVPSRDRKLLIADLSLDPEHYDDIVATCAALHEGGWHIEWRDHHHKQWEGLDLSRLEEHVEVLDVNDDATESGASLMQQAIAKKDRFAKKLAETIRDRDLWWNKTPDSETLEFAINHMGEDAFTQHMLERKARDAVVDDVIQAAADAERAMVEEHTKILLDDAMYYEADNGDKVGVVFGWLPKNVGLHRLLQKKKVRVAVNVRPNGKMSLRSRKDAPVTHLVARRFKGGGHPNASGGDLGLSGLGLRWYLLRRGRVSRTQEVAKAAVEELENYEENGDA